VRSVTTRPILRMGTFTDPVLFPVGSMTMQSSVLACILLYKFRVPSRTYSPKAHLKSLSTNSSLGLALSYGLVKGCAVC
jgi:hypothetical protein